MTASVLSKEMASQSAKENGQPWRGSWPFWLAMHVVQRR
jgi:hypothetical protein